MLVPVVRAHGRLAGLPCPDLAVRAGDDGLVAVAGDPTGFRAVRQADSCETGGAVGKVVGLPVFVQQDGSIFEALGLDNADFRVLFDPCGLAFSLPVASQVQACPSESMMRAWLAEATAVTA